MLGIMMTLNTHTLNESIVGTKGRCDGSGGEKSVWHGESQFALGNVQFKKPRKYQMGNIM